MIPVKVGSEVRLNEFVAERSGNALRLRDPYSSQSFEVPEDVGVLIVPVLPMNVPKRVATHLYLSFESPIVFEEPTEIWAAMPYEVAVLAGDKVLKVMSPFKVKHTVFGTPADGLICRWYKTRLIDDPEGYAGVEALGKVTVKVEKPDVVSGLIFDMRDVNLYIAEAGEGLRVYYDLLSGKVKEGVLRADNTARPPLEGLRRLPRIVGPGRLAGFIARVTGVIEREV